MIIFALCLYVAYYFLQSVYLLRKQRARYVASEFLIMSAQKRVIPYSTLGRLLHKGSRPFNDKPRQSHEMDETYTYLHNANGLRFYKKISWNAPSYSP